MPLQMDTEYLDSEAKYEVIKKEILGSDSEEGEEEDEDEDTSEEEKEGLWSVFFFKIP